MLEFIYKLIRLLKRKFNTWIFKIKYFPFISLGKSVYVEERVKMKQFWINKQKMKIILKDFSYIKNDVIIQGSGKFILGKRAYISSYSVIGVNELIEIKDNVMIADNVTIRDTDHTYDDISIPMINQGIKTSPVIIENNVWIGHGVTITKGVCIGEGSIVAAGSVVNKNIPKFSIVGGIPGKVIKERK